MQLTERTKISLRIVFGMIAAGIVAGAIYGWFAGGQQWPGALRGAVVGLLISSSLSAFEALLIEGPFGHFFRNTPFLVMILGKSVVYLAVIVFGLTAGMELVHLPFAEKHPTHGLTGIAAKDLTFAITVAIGMNFVMAVSQLLGQKVLWRFLTGRYHRPREERRIFLFIDMVGSTGIAERIGSLAFHRLLNRFFGDLTAPVLEHKGEVHKYVGDEIIITWPMATGTKQARCLRACLAAAEALQRLGPAYEHEFGIRPRFRAALHAGPVVSGEMGEVKREIVFLGDAVNTAERMLQVCRERDCGAVISAALLTALELPAEVVAKPLGPVKLRGRREAIELFAIELPGEAAAGRVVLASMGRAG